MIQEVGGGALDKLGSWWICGSSAAGDETTCVSLCRVCRVVRHLFPINRIRLGSVYFQIADVRFITGFNENSNDWLWLYINTAEAAL